LDWIARSRAHVKEEKEAEAKRQAAELVKTKKRLRTVWGLLAAAGMALLAAGYFGYNANLQKKAADEATFKAEQSLIISYNSDITRFKGEIEIAERNRNSFEQYKAQDDVIRLETQKIDSLTNRIDTLEIKIKLLKK